MMVDRIVVYFKLNRPRKYRVRMLLHAVSYYNSSVYLSERFVFISRVAVVPVAQDEVTQYYPLLFRSQSSTSDHLQFLRVITERTAR